MNQYSEFRSRYGRFLYDLLPAVYREQDNTTRDARRQVTDLGHLAKYLDACGLLLDRLRATLDQRLGDAFADNPASGRACQDWLLPYFARLLDVGLVSPDVTGRRDEVFKAVRWRQGKGTLPVAEEICESVTRLEVEVQEGWRRVAVTPRVNMPLLAASVYGVDPDRCSGDGARIARHPALPAATVDLRCASRAVRAAKPNLITKQSRLGGEAVLWQQANPHGVPAHPGAFDDVARLTVDLHDADALHGHAHPRRLLAYGAVPRGLFPPAPWVVEAGQIKGSRALSWAEDTSTDGVWRLTIAGVSDRPVVIDGNLDLGPLLPPGAEAVEVQLSNIQIRGTLILPRGALRIGRAVVNELDVATAFFSADAPVLTASDCLFGAVSVEAGYSRLSSCTVRGQANFGALIARDCLFADDTTVSGGAGDIRYCRIPAGLTPAPDLFVANCVTAPPSYFASAADDPALPLVEPDAGVLRPDNPSSILFGAEDGGEMGAYHAGRGQFPIVVTKEQPLGALGNTNGYVLADLVFAGRLTVAGAVAGSLRFARTALAELTIQPSSVALEAGVPLVDARSSLFDELTVNCGITRLEYCTILRAASVAVIQASDSMFVGTLKADDSQATVAANCLRYSRLPSEAPVPPPRAAAWPYCTSAAPIFFNADFAAAAAGAAGCGVLHWAAPAALTGGAEDGGELGAYHERRFCLTRSAVLDKLVAHLPVGIEPVWIPDDHLYDRLPEFDRSA